MRIAKANYRDFFDHTWLEPETTLVALDAQPYHSKEASIELTPHFLAAAEGAITHIATVRTSFEAAKERLWELATTNAPLGFAHTLGEARSILRTIESILRASADAGGYVCDVNFNISRQLARSERRHGRIVVSQQMRHHGAQLQASARWVRLAQETCARGKHRAGV